MKKLFLAASLAFALQAARAQTLPARREGETLKQFASRVTPRGARLDHVVEGDFGPSRANVVVIFEAETEHGHFLDGLVLVPEGVGYRKHKLAGADFVRLSKVSSIFFADADGDPDRELVVIVTYPSEDSVPSIGRAEICDPHVFDWDGRGFVRVAEASDYLSGNAYADGNTPDCTAAGMRRLLSRRAQRAATAPATHTPAQHATEPPTSQRTHRVGERVEVEWRGEWWPAEVLGLRGGKYRVHYTGWDSSWDEDVVPARIRKPRAGSAQAAKAVPVKTPPRSRAASPSGTSSPAKTPEAAARALYNAWKAKDRQAALKVATPAAVNALFADKFFPMQFVECRKGEEVFCTFDYEAGGLFMMMEGDAARGYRVKAIDYGVD
jgi:hypothetical protein